LSVGQSQSYYSNERRALRVRDSVAGVETSAFAGTLIGRFSLDQGREGAGAIMISRKSMNNWLMAGLVVGGVVAGSAATKASADDARLNVTPAVYRSDESSPAKPSVQLAGYYGRGWGYRGYGWRGYGYRPYYRPYVYGYPAVGFGYPAYGYGYGYPAYGYAPGVSVYSPRAGVGVGIW
jgi:hypothetical protein